MMNELWTVKVDKTRCVGSSLCIEIAPNAFEIVNGKSTPRSSWQEADESIAEAWESCPMSAIALINSDGIEVQPS
jgi:ferredoxin